MDVRVDTLAADSGRITGYSEVIPWCPQSRVFGKFGLSGIEVAGNPFIRGVRFVAE